MDPVKKIESLEAKREALEKQLLVPGIDKDEKLDIRQQIIAIDTQITEWCKLLLKPVAPSETTWKFQAIVAEGARYRNFRKQVYELAVRHGGYDENIKYSETPITSNASLNVEIYFMTMIQCHDYRSSLLTLVERYGGVEPIHSVSKDFTHACSNLTKKSNMNQSASDTPDRGSWDKGTAVDDPLSVNTSVYHAELSEEDIRRECVCAFETFTTNGSNQKALWCHIRARKRCRSEDEKKDTANRLVMNWALHSMFDDNLTNDGVTPTLSVYCNPKSTVDTTNGYVQLQLNVVFKCVRDAEVYAKMLREPVQQTSRQEFVILVEKKRMDVQNFIAFLNERHDTVFKKW